MTESAATVDTLGSPHLPLPREQRHGTALCLSGGGYRAALFHLGAARRLNELGALTRIDTFTSVSGGSMFLAQLASDAARHPDAWALRGPLPDFDERIAQPLHDFTQRNIRTRTVLRRLQPRHWRDPNAQIDALAERLAAGPAGSARLSDLPERPRFVFCASEMQFRGLWTADGSQVGSHLSGTGAPGDWTIARAAAASSCLPGVFAPMRIAPPGEGGSYRGADRSALLGRLALSDGGMFDNLGVEPVWQDHATVLVSDAGPAFRPDPGLGRIWNALRFAIILLEQATDVRKRWLVSNFLAGQLDGTYWGIAGSPSSYPERAEATVYSDELIQDSIAPIRIDLDVFSEGERAVLENHGYLMAETALRSHVPGLTADGAPAPRAPHPEWMDEERAATALRDSGTTKLFSRGWFH
jgi:NTE family protein